MDIAPFKVEEWMNEYETGARYNIAETCVDSLSLDQLFALAGEDKAAFWEAFCARRMTYGDIEGAPAFKQGVAGLFRTVQPRDIVTTHGAAGANHHVFYSLVRPGDHVISVAPTYQQLYAIPAGFGARVELLHLRREDGFLPDSERLRQMVRPDTRLICLNNPNNPTGALMDGAMLREIVDIARSIGAYVLCDEVYRFLTQEDGWSESIADLYEKGISVGSMSKVFSLAGLRQGWIVCRDQAFIRACLSHRDYDLVSCSQFDEAISAPGPGPQGQAAGPQPDHCAGKPGRSGRLGGKRTPGALCKTQRRHHRPGVLRRRPAQLRVLPAHVPRYRRLRDAGRLLRGGTLRTHRLRLRPAGPAGWPGRLQRLSGSAGGRRLSPAACRFSGQEIPGRPCPAAQYLFNW